MKEEQEGPETYHTSPWRLLVVSIVRPVVGDLFDRYPSPEAMAEADEEELAGMIRRLGLYRKRAKALVDFSRTYLDSPPWRTPAELKYFGKYADDSYRLFCLGGTSLSLWLTPLLLCSSRVRPRDKKLKQYRDWLFAHYGAKKSESELEEEHEWAEQERKEERKRARAATLNSTKLEGDFDETGMEQEDDTEEQSIVDNAEEDVPRLRKERKTKKRRAPDEVKADAEETG
ncbi:base excision DNA repair protein, HhHGPD subfamily protein [Acanthamoeba castellanii str. Neff]|uniref:Base excision DNA repair protein, HhHGPD subfamily protein n=1 Tax=Acanthamoeba castellanii (strain ATCC 30010 / Neff) TaxID=1257118 RepID=L8HIW9_ACACF|nr:base excision DNA repair protein, HhHGPD subfamily protein [Acanthamoeba castellanii str. Neff]ELR25157.1 base excision DNA repair protein, HhHGPD subfamily protein [Acanthamoeba castellanii str. Neff]